MLKVPGFYPPEVEVDKEPWNRCDICGKFIALEHFGEGGKAVRHMLTPDSDRSSEEWETLCPEHAPNH